MSHDDITQHCQSKSSQLPLLTKSNPVIRQGSTLIQAISSMVPSSPQSWEGKLLLLLILPNHQFINSPHCFACPTPCSWCPQVIFNIFCCCWTTTPCLTLLKAAVVMPDLIPEACSNCLQNFSFGRLQTLCNWIRQFSKFPD